MNKITTTCITAVFCVLFLILFNACDKNTTSTSETPPSTSTNPVVTGSPAINALTEKITANPEDPTLYANRAAIFYEQEGYDEAIMDIGQALKRDSTNVDYYHFLADVYMDYFKSMKALKTMEYVAEMYPERIPTLLKLSEFQMILKKNKESLQTVENIFKLDPQNAEAWFMSGMNFRDMKDEKRAINSFQTAVENDPDLIDGWIILGQLFAARKNKIAEKYFDNALRIDSLNMEGLNSKANYLHNEGRLGEAIQYYKKVNIVDPQYSDSYYNSGLAYVELDSVNRAYQLFDITIKTDPLHIMGYFYRGVMSERKGDIKAAKSDYQQALNLAPNFERAQKALNNIQK